MLIQLLVERDQNTCFVKLAGTAYKFERNEHGHLVANITDVEHIRWVNDPINTSFKEYRLPKPTIVEETVEDTVDTGEVPEGEEAAEHEPFVISKEDAAKVANIINARGFLWSDLATGKNSITVSEVGVPLPPSFPEGKLIDKVTFSPASETAAPKKAKGGKGSKK